MSINKAFQLRLLKQLAIFYGRPVNTTDQTGPEALNLLYLEEHGLVICNKVVFPSRMHVVTAKITANGLDYLDENGGLTAELGVVTVRLHADTIRDLVAARIEQSDLPPENKSQLKDHLKALPEKALGHLTTRLVDLALQGGPKVMEAIQTALSHGL